MVTCSNCGDPNVEWSENTRPNKKGVPKKWLINKNTGSDHKCGPTSASNLKPTGYTKHAEDKVDRCRYGCGKMVRYYSKYFNQPKLQEVDTFRQHNYQRCGNIIRSQGREPPFQHSPAVEFFDHPIEDQLQFIKHSMPPESKIWDLFRPKLEKSQYMEAQRGIEPEIHKIIKNMNLMEYVSLLIHLGHKKPIPPPAINV